MTLPFPPDDPLIEVYPVSFQTPKRPTDQIPDFYSTEVMYVNASGFKKKKKTGPVTDEKSMLQHP